MHKPSAETVLRSLADYLGRIGVPNAAELRDIEEIHDAADAAVALGILREQGALGRSGAVAKALEHVIACGLSRLGELGAWDGCTNEIAGKAIYRDFMEFPQHLD